MKIVVPALIATVLAAQPAVAAEKLSYLSSRDAEAVGFFKCAIAVEAVRDLMLEDGYDVYSGVPAALDKAGRATVVKAALLAEENGARPKVRKLAFTSERAERLISNDIAVHRRAADHELSSTSLPAGFDTLADCLSPAKLDKAQSLGEWFDEDVSLFWSLRQGETQRK